MRELSVLVLALVASGCATEVVVEDNRAADYGGKPALERARSLAKSVDSLASGTGNLGRYTATIDRIRELGLRTYMRTSWIDWWTPQKNITLEIPGLDANGQEPIVYVVAHYDKTEVRPDALLSRLFLDALEPLFSWSYAGSGAVDDASGCSVVLELAREVAAHPRAETFRFVLLGAEESAQRGSRCYVAGIDHRTVNRTRLVVKLDSVGVRGSSNGVLESTTRPEIVSAAMKIANRRGFDLTRWVAPGPFCGDDGPWADASPLLDVARGLYFDPLGLLPQRSWFTRPKSLPTIAFSSVDSVAELDSLTSLVPLPLGSVHGARDQGDKLDAWLLYEQFEIVRELTALTQFDPSVKAN